MNKYMNLISMNYYLDKFDFIFKMNFIKYISIYGNIIKYIYILGKPFLSKIRKYFLGRIHGFSRQNFGINRR